MIIEYLERSKTVTGVYYKRNEFANFATKLGKSAGESQPRERRVTTTMRQCTPLTLQ